MTAAIALFTRCLPACGVWYLCRMVSLIFQNGSQLLQAILRVTYFDPGHV